MTFLEKMNAELENATAKTAAAQDRQKIFADQHRREQTYKIGDKVWLSTANFRMQKGKTKKLAVKFKGPYTSQRIKSSTAYRLDLRGTLKVHPTFHVSQLKPFKESDDYPRVINVERPGAIEEFEDGSKTLAMEKIIGKKTIKGKPYYKIRWQGYDSSEDTWEPPSSLKNVQHLVDEYNTSHR